MVYYKYREWNDYTKKLLETNEFWFSSPKHFNDPFDCQIRINRDDINETLAIDFLSQSYAKSKDEKSHFYNRAYSNFDECKGDLEEVCDFLRERIRDFEEYFDDKGILSLSANPKSLLMWGHYGQNHKGISIGLADTSGAFLADSRFSNDVNYQSEYPKITARDIVMAKSSEDWDVFVDLIFHTKSSEWSYEKERRVVMSKGDKLYKTPCVITEVIFGARCDKSTEQEIRDLLHGSDVRFRKALLKTQSFDMVIVDV
ncbi:DUF2971 domain-containing protein [Alteromonas sp. PRIM-21]|uniref:DUF2971 domain-containing protein n=1 Tax=Alteromonas sp. PRIM-21 TaxID=1454978 RepID=UPI0022B9667A|nr:DUF2971 domain-containing protein [Alteromonas sp. PRIM-21]MCZ8531163.1 DUF2971 domain-containing protein [Alteromonas sp. PRIM-21]